MHVGEASGTVCFLNGFLPPQSAGPLHLPQTGIFVRRSALAPGVALGNRTSIFCMELLYANLTATIWNLSQARISSPCFFVRDRSFRAVPCGLDAPDSHFSTVLSLVFR